MKNRGCLIALIVAAVFALLAVGAVLLLAQTPQSAREPVKIPDLRPKLSAAENARPLLEEATSLVTGSTDTAAWEQARKRPWEANPKAEKRVRANAAALAKLDAALARKGLVIPRVEDFDALFPYLSKWRELARIKVMRGQWRLRRGETEAGLRDFVEVVEFGHQVERCGGPVIHYLVGVAIKAIGCRTMAASLGPPPGSPPAGGWRASGWTKAQVRHWCAATRELEAYAESASGLRVALSEEFHVFESMIRDPALLTKSAKHTGLPPALRRPPRWLLNPDKTVAMGSHYYGQFLAQCDKPLWECEPVDISELEFPSRAGARVRFFLWNPIGRVLLSITMPVFDRPRTQAASAEVDVAAARVQIALKCYLERHGRAPQSLAELVPEFLDETPIDAFDGKPLRYASERGLVYSVGSDGTDDGGKTGGKWDDPDIVFPLAFVVAPVTAGTPVAEAPGSEGNQEPK